MSVIDDKIKIATDRVAKIKQLIPPMLADAQIMSVAYNIAIQKGDSVGADINRNANISTNGKITLLQQELDSLIKPGGVIAQLLIDKQNESKAKNKVIDSSLTATQKAAIELAKINAKTEVDAVKAKNQKIYIIVGIIVIVIAVFVYIKFFK